MMKWVASWVWIVILAISCTKDKIEEPNTDVGYEYFPLKIGASRVYQMDSVLYDIRSDGQASGRSVRSYMQEELIDTFRNEENDLVYKWAVSWRAELDQAWTQSGFVLEQRDERRALRTEDHWRFVKLIFPIKIDQSWNGNVFLDAEQVFRIEDEPIKLFRGWGNYSLEANDLQLEIHGRVFDRVLRVREAQSESVLDLRESIAYYAPNVGLIKRTQRIFELECNQTPEDPCHVIGEPWEQDAERGYALVQELIDFK